MQATERINIRTTPHAKALIERRVKNWVYQSAVLWLKVPMKKP